ncbi:hypothetical protein HYQ46_008607 [Verticillium longisporum]|nr:hypothetical protein HYQ46_008607 [Verticillium longisporum]
MDRGGGAPPSTGTQLVLSRQSGESCISTMHRSPPCTCRHHDSGWGLQQHVESVKGRLTGLVGGHLRVVALQPQLIGY